MGKLDGKVAIVTGAASGIGRATALLFAQEGAKVVAADVAEEKGRATAAEIGRAGGQAAFARVDVSQAEQVESMVRTAVDRFGRLDVLFNNAGIDGEFSLIGDSSIENWNRVLAVNLTGVYLGMKYGAQAMLKSGGGSIISTSSVAGVVGFPTMAAYCASKGGVIQLTKSAALDYGRLGIRVNAICPGVIETPMVEALAKTSEAVLGLIKQQTPAGRFGTADEVAKLALFLASDDSSFCTGASFIVDGGWVAQ